MRSRRMIMMTAFLFALPGCEINISSPGNPGGAHLLCQLTAAPTAPLVGQTVSYSLQVSGGTAPYQLSGFAFDQSSASPSANTTLPSATVFQLQTTFSQPGDKTAVANVTDAAGASASCSTLVSVEGPSSPEISVTASPSPRVPLNGMIQLTATALGLDSSDGSLVYRFSSDSPGVSVTSAENVATVKDSDGTPHDAAITIIVYRNNGVCPVNAECAVPLYCLPGAGAYCGGLMPLLSETYMVRFSDDGGPWIQIVATPGTSTTVGGTIGLQATPIGFPSNTTIGFSTAEAGIGLASNGASAEVDDSDGRGHAFTVQVSATYGSVCDPAPGYACPGWAAAYEQDVSLEFHLPYPLPLAVGNEPAPASAPVSGVVGGH